MWCEKDKYPSKSILKRPTGKTHTTDALKIQILSKRIAFTTRKRQNEWCR